MYRQILKYQHHYYYYYYYYSGSSYIYIYIYILEQLGVTAFFESLFDRGTFLGTPVNLLLSSQKCQGVPFFPVCPQPKVIIIIIAMF